MKSKFIVVSNRLPVSVSRVDGALTFSVSSGGLATAMSSLSVKNQLWVGWPGLPSDDLTPSEKAQITRTLKKHGCLPVFLTKDEVADFYEGYANDTLWPLFHYFPSLAQYRDKYWRAYESVNQRFARAALKVAEDDATIWIQDYQLMLTPSMVRDRLPSAKIGFFLHIPFPSYEIFRLLPERRRIMRGLMGADLIGFHIYDYARHFISSASRILGAKSDQGVIEYQGHRTTADVFPIGVDYEKFRKTLASKAVKDEIAVLDERYGDQRIILSVDRLDYSKGIMKRLEAYEQLLSMHPKLHRTVTLLMIAVPSRTEVETYKNLRDEIEQAVSRINGLYGTTDWAPISYQFQNLPFERIVALYARSEVALVTPLRDGMNLVAKEYVASKNGQKGVLILSEMAGAADELSQALIVNPNDTPALAQTIYQALKMPNTEQQRRLKAMQARIGDYTVQKWGEDFLTQLERARANATHGQKKRLTRDEQSAIVTSFIKSKKRLILLDYDGTLHGFSSDIRPDAVRPGPRLRAQLKHISEQHDTRLCIISGRSRKTLDQWFRGIPSLTLVAEHGAWIKQDGIWHQNATAYDKKPILSLLREFATRTPGAIVEEKDFALVWHYRAVNPELAYIRNVALRHELRELTADTDLVVHNGNKIIEIKPSSIDKGNVAQRLAKEFPADFVFAAGDDYTDEAMFAALGEDAITLKVGSGDTSARHRVSRLERLLEIIASMSKIIR